MTITVKEVAYASPAYKNILAIRYEMLRKPIGIEVSEKDVALDHAEYLIAAYDGEKMVGCVQMRPLEPQLIKLRQMAVVETYQGKGVGAKLVKFAEDLAVRNSFKMVETNARKTAQGFYEKLGYQTLGNPFIEVSLHTIKMMKQLTAA